MAESEQVAQGTALVHIDYRMFALADPMAAFPVDIESVNGLVFSQSGIAVILTGVSGGCVAVTVEVHSHRPGSVATDGWDDVVDHTLYTAAGQVSVRSVMEAGPDLPLLTPYGPGQYGIRVHVRGRDHCPDGISEEVAEEYRILVWPLSPDTSVVHKQTDQVGSSWRASYMQQATERRRPVQERLVKVCSRPDVRAWRGRRAPNSPAIASSSDRSVWARCSPAPSAWAPSAPSSRSPKNRLGSSAGGTSPLDRTSPST